MDKDIIKVVQGIIEKFPSSKNDGTPHYKSLDEFNAEFDTILWREFSVADIRIGRTRLTPSCNQRDSHDKKLKFFQQFSVRLLETERARPFDEQFPYVCNDLDGLLKATAALEKITSMLAESTSNLANSTAIFENGVRNKSKEMEMTVNASFLSVLENRGWSAVEVHIDRGIIHKLDTPSVELVQWDGLVSATNKETAEEMLFLIETKEIAHINDIRGNWKGLYERGVRTFDYITQLKLPLPKGTTYNASTKMQHTIFKSFADYNITLVYASGIISDEIKQMALEVNETFKLYAYPKQTQVWLMECPRFFSSTLSVMAENSWTTDEWRKSDAKGGHSGKDSEEITATQNQTY